MDESDSFVEYSNYTPADKSRGASILAKAEENSFKLSNNDTNKSKSALNTSIRPNEVINESQQQLHSDGLSVKPKSQISVNQKSQMFLPNPSATPSNIEEEE